MHALKRSFSTSGCVAGILKVGFKWEMGGDIFGWWRPARAADAGLSYEGSFLSSA